MPEAPQPSRTVAEENELEREKRLQRKREVARAFLEVFGPPGAPTKHGQIILEALHATFGRGIPKNVCDDHGRTDALQTWRHLGHYDVLEMIHESIAWKESDHVDTRRTGSR